MGNHMGNPVWVHLKALLILSSNTEIPPQLHFSSLEKSQQLKRTKAWDSNAAQMWVILVERSQILSSRNGVGSRTEQHTHFWEHNLVLFST